MGIALTYDEVNNRIQELYSGDYTLLKYINTRKLNVRHNKCGTIFDTSGNIFIGKVKCPRCDKKSQKINTDIFKMKVYDLCGDEYSVLGEYVNAHKKIEMRHNKCGFEFDIQPTDFVNNGTRCPYCGNRAVWINHNDLWTTHPEIAKLLKNPEDGYKYSYGTHTKLEFLCPTCSDILLYRPRDLYNHNGIPKCKKCNDGFSFPEKFVCSLFEQLCIDFIWQYTKKYVSWCDRYMYDFYLPKYNCIVEVHGIQHYEYTGFGISLEETIENDNNKMQHAYKNNIDNYIIIDARESDMTYIKNSIMQSHLASMFNLEYVDWNLCVEKASKSVIYDICDLWNSGLKTYDEISQKVKLHKVTVRKYLEIGSQCGLCDYNKEEYCKDAIKRIGQNNIKTQSKPVKCIETGQIYTSRKEVERNGIYFGKNVIDNPSKTAGGYHWVSVDKSELTNSQEKTKLI